LSKDGNARKAKGRWGRTEWEARREGRNGRQGGKDGKREKGGGEGKREKWRGGGEDAVFDQRVVTAARPFPLHEHARYIQRLRKMEYLRYQTSINGSR
jgi:hypothetical protein